jgi:hypothetical protein
VVDGAVLPRKFEPFPEEMYGRPLEEIDNFIYEEVSKQVRLQFIDSSFIPICDDGWDREAARYEF